MVLPCLDEQDAVGLCVRQARDVLRAAGLDGEVVVLDNRPTDNSIEVATAAGAPVIAEPRRGYGRALRTGIDQADADVVVMADADGTYDLSKFSQVVRPRLDGDADLVLASRLEDAGRDSMPLLHRYLGTPVITFLTSRACGRRVTADSQTGYRWPVTAARSGSSAGADGRVRLVVAGSATWPGVGLSDVVLARRAPRRLRQHPPAPVGKRVVAPRGARTDHPAGGHSPPTASPATTHPPTSDSSFSPP